VLDVLADFMRPPKIDLEQLPDLDKFKDKIEGADEKLRRRVVIEINDLLSRSQEIDVAAHLVAMRKLAAGETDGPELRTGADAARDTRRQPRRGRKPKARRAIASQGADHDV